ncbi:MAG TPA: DNA polymerase III subunit gamma and tau [Candidatus Corynebacterium gallistercoris]|uniref:DNA polymerase III subunit gamma/tau n=1 Tax=Candidatus Corynebacterium gallistercoris TaxID=2838530 RepID=A0A9D1UPQ6_9CORY|nr:DNA polymerase III subunit gamma and tau [Candidatus Corynebacterium gallistercoris]
MALYRKYRPATFAEVVGQAHVTEPLSVALDSGRINHAYLFSGPRGCGKTSSARILARSLNCVQGPTSTPCGVCDSCVSLAPGGPGNLDVTELDAATHNGVDDMRELRERAFYAPAESRYRVFIIDEAHMISTAGFNALLKIVEEPPEHLIFIFATTEPEKLLQTIRSRTHNYPFRLLTPPDMRALLTSVVEGEGVAVEDTVYPLVVRAGGGSPRDSLSIMDQLLAGAGPEGVTYTRALALLGVTDITLIDRAVDALAEHDQAGLFGVVDEVIEAGYDPRRFAEDLLDRFRDLLVLQAVPDAIDRGLVNAPADAREALEHQAAELGQATLTRCAALVNEGLAQMRGATAPRLLLEILCARMALPAAGMTVEALAQRVEALEAGKGVAPSAAAGQAPNLSSGRKYERPSRRKAQQPEEPAQQEQQQREEQLQREEPRAQTQGVPEQPVEQQPTRPAESETTAEPNQAAESTESADPAEPPEVAEARRAREILDRNRHGAARTEVQPQAQPEAEPQAYEEPAEAQEPEQEPEPQPKTPAQRWAEILTKVQELDLSAWIALRGAVVNEDQPREDEVHVTHHTGALANYVNSETHAQTYTQAIEQVTGTPARVIANAGNPGSASNAGSGSSQGGPAHQEANQEAHQEPPGKAEAAQASQPVPAEQDLQPTTIRTAASSVLERARAMEEALNQTAAKARSAGATAGGAAGSQGQSPQSAEAADKPSGGWRAKVERARARKQYNQDNGFNGVPLPDEPPADPWDQGPPDSMPAYTPSEASAGEAEVASPPRNEETEEQRRRRQEDELLEDMAKGPGEMDHRTPLDVAGELIEKHLGASRVR